MSSFGGKWSPDRSRRPDPRLTFVAVTSDDALAEPLFADLAVEYSQRYGSTETAVMTWLRSHPEEIAPPDGDLVIGLIDGRPVTGGAFCRFDDATAELKRIWTDRQRRKQGLGRALLAELESRIVQRGYRRIYLTTGDRQPEAEALYAAAGYQRLAEPLAAQGDVFPIAFAKAL